MDKPVEVRPQPDSPCLESANSLRFQVAVQRVNGHGLCAEAQCESLKYKLTQGLAIRRACYGVLRFIMESGARGCEIVVSGKIRGQRAKTMKFVDGTMIHSGNSVGQYVRESIRHVGLKAGKSS